MASRSKTGKSKATPLPQGIDSRNKAEAAVWLALPPADAETALTVKEIVAAMPAADALSESTVGKQLRTLANKGYAAGSKNGRAMVWRRAEPPEPGSRAEAEAVAARLTDKYPQDADSIAAALELSADANATAAPEAPASAGVADTPAEPGTGGSDELSAVIGDLEANAPVSAPPATDVAVPAAPTEQMSEAEARKLTDRIKAALTDFLPMIKEAYTRRAHTALGYGSWSAYCDAEMRGLRMPLTDRQTAVRELTAAGMSTRAVAGALGTSDATVRRDLDATGGTGDEPRRVAGLDGKSYDSKARTPKGPKATAGKVSSVEGDAPRPHPVERDTCGNCKTDITRRLDAPGDQWRHQGTGGIECEGMPGSIAEPWQAPPAPPETIDGETVESPAESASIVDANLTAAGSAGLAAEVAAPTTREDPVEAIAAELRGFAWGDYDMGAMPLGADAEWIRDLSEAIANRLGL